MSIKVITIDFWNTLFDSSGGTERNDLRLKILINEIDKYGIVVKREEFESALVSTWEFFNSIWFSEQRTPEPIESIGFFWNKLNLPEDKNALDKLVRIFSESILIHPPKLIRDVENILNVLSKNYKLGIVSDTGFSPGIVLRQLLKDSKIYDYFSEFSFSDETGVSKPHEKAFLKILNSLDCKSNEAVHIGDIEKTDIVGAKNLRMKAILFAGDKTSTMIKHNNNTTISDFQASNWKEIPNLIEILSKTK